MKLASAVALLALTGPATGQILGAQTPGAADPAMPASVSLLDGWSEADGTRMLGFLVELDPGWKTYWRAPGELGIPPRFDWRGSENLAGVEVLWPVPQVFVAGLGHYAGYAGAMLLPLRVSPRDPGKPMHLRLTASFGVCEDVCIPAQSSVEAVLTPDASRAERAWMIDEALTLMPVAAVEAGLVGVDCVLSPRPDGMALEAVLRFAGEPAPVAMAVVEVPHEDLWIAAPEVERSGATVTLRTEMEYFGEGALALDRDGFRFTLIGVGTAVEHLGCRLPG